MPRWTQEEETGLILFTPVLAAGDNILDKLRIGVDPVSGQVHLATIGTHGDVSTRVLRPADARRIGTALIESAVIGDSLGLLAAIEPAGDAPR
jgi:hypothetical protein